MTTTIAAEASPQGALRLADWGLLRASGADARSFLHGQLTQDLLHLPEGQARLAGYCSAKGRLLASFVVWADGPEDVLLACSADLLSATLKRLSMFVLRAKCKLTDVSADVELWGLAGPAAAGEAWAVVREGEVTTVGLPPAAWGGEAVARALRVQPRGHAAPAAPHLDLEPWLALEAMSGVPRIVAATADQFVPQMVNLELVGGVNFKKGCYPGQEVVARSQYRGTLKRRGFLLTAPAAFQPGQELFHSADPGQPAGQVALAGRSAGGVAVALAELKLAATQGGTLHLGAPDGPLAELGALPYALPADAD